MIKEAIDRILKLAVPTVVDSNDAVGKYSDKTLNLIEKPGLPCLYAHNLSAIVEYIPIANIEYATPKLFISVLDEAKVALLMQMNDSPNSSRQILLSVQFDGNYQPFRFDRTMSREDFTIALQSKFNGTTDMARLLKLAGNMTASKTHESNDDGVSQSVTQKAGVSLQSTAEIKNPFSLQPHRVFSELVQPESNFIFRVHQRAEELPQCALYECDGGAWRMDAIKKIKDYYRALLPDIQVIG